MSKINKLFLWIGLVVLILAGLFFGADYYVKNKIETTLREDFPQLKYENFSVSTLAGNLTLNFPQLKIGKFNIEAENIQLRNFDYSDYLMNGEIVINKVKILQPKLVHNESDSVAGSSGEKSGKRQNILVKEVEIDGGSLRMVENDTAANTLYLSLQNFFVYDLELPSKAGEGGLPFDYERISFETDSIFLEMNKEHNIAVENIIFEDKNLFIKNFQIIPKYTRQEFDRQIPFEKDHIQLNIDSIKFKDLTWRIRNDSLYFSGPFTEISNADLEIYRNKMLPDDPRIKPLYSKMLREMGTKLEFDSVKVNGSRIVYEENVAEDRPPGKIEFHEVTADIKNLRNTDLEKEGFPDTVVEAEALFQGISTLTLNLVFNVKDEGDEFNASGYFAGIEAEAINSFLTPALNVKVEGDIESLYYNFHGNPEVANGDMQMSYRDFKVNLLRNGNRKDLLSWLTNLVIKNDVVNEDINQEDVEAERDKTKSFWNYLWLFIRNGALKTFL